MVRFVRLAIGLLICVASAGCANVEPLSDVTLIEIKLATPTDLARYARAEDVRSREMFGGASFSDGNGRIVASFTAAEYDRYLAYTRDHPLTKPGSELHQEPAWPMMRLSFQSHRVLFDPGASSMQTVLFSLCDAKEDEQRLGGLGMQDVMWHDRFVTPKVANAIENALKTDATPQEYEVFFKYVYWDNSSVRQKGEPVTLLPLPGDLCIAFHQFNSPLPASVGRPLRINKDLINDAVGPLPRTLAVDVSP